MKWLFVLAAACLPVFGASNADLAGIKTVYLLPMSSGLDQYLAVRLTTGAVLQVVTDPHKADAIFTDRIGAGFEQNLDEIYGSSEAKDQKAKEEKAKEKANDADSSSGEQAATDDFSRPVSQPISRGKGSIFLVNPKTRAVIWSTYAVPKSKDSGDMNHLARTIAARLEKDRKTK